VGSAQTDITNPYETVPCGCIYFPRLALLNNFTTSKARPSLAFFCFYFLHDTDEAKIVGFAMDGEPNGEARGTDLHEAESLDKSSPLQP
jgi:peroxin-2